MIFTIKSQLDLELILESQLINYVLLFFLFNIPQSSNFSLSNQQIRKNQ